MENMDGVQAHAPNDANANVLKDPNAGNIDKIRDILFGSLRREYEQRFAHLEETLRKESAELRDATRKRVEGLEALVQKEFSALEARLNAERDQRSDQHSRVTADLSATSASLHKRIADFESQEAQAKRELRGDLLQQSKDLNDAIYHKATELSALLDRRFQELHHAKTDRAGLADLFSEVALRLNDQFKVAGAE